MSVNFDEVRKNVEKDDIPLGEIAIIYDNLTDDEMNQMNTHGLIAHISGKKVIGKFNANGKAMFPDKATAVIYLGG